MIGGFALGFVVGIFAGWFILGICAATRGDL